MKCLKPYKTFFRAYLGLSLSFPERDSKYLRDSDWTSDFFGALSHKLTLGSISRDLSGWRRALQQNRVLVGFWLSLLCARFVSPSKPPGPGAGGFWSLRWKSPKKSAREAPTQSSSRRSRWMSSCPTGGATSSRNSWRPSSTRQLGSHGRSSSGVVRGVLRCSRIWVFKLGGTRCGFPFGCGSKLNSWGYAGFGPCFHLPGFHLGTSF